jgi:hypothetical protein
MNLDDLTAVWRSQDASPLHGVSEPLLRLALREDEAKLQAQRRWESRIIYAMSAVFIAGMVIFFVLMFGMLFYNDDDVIIGWDLAIPIVGAAAALFMGVHLYVTRRAQAQREQRFGDSLRDQLDRSIAQLDDEARRGIRTMTVSLISIFVFATAIRLAFMRVNLEPNEPFGFDDWPGLGRRILIFAILWVVGRWAVRRSVKRDLVPRKRRLEAVLKELEAP